MTTSGKRMGSAMIKTEPEPFACERTNEQIVSCFGCGYLEVGYLDRNNPNIYCRDCTYPDSDESKATDMVNQLCALCDEARGIKFDDIRCQGCHLQQYWKENWKGII
jgi:hypothetical protein